MSTADAVKLSIASGVVSAQPMASTVASARIVVPLSSVMRSRVGWPSASPAPVPAPVAESPGASSISVARARCWCTEIPSGSKPNTTLKTQRRYSP